MADLGVLAIGFGVIPLSSLLLYTLRDRIAAYREIVWGGLAGALAFLGISHAMAYVLETKPFLFGGANEGAAILFLALGLGLGGTAAWFLLGGSRPDVQPVRIVWACVAFLALHSVGDGLVLGRGFVGGLIPVVRIDFLTISATIVHRFVEGALVLVPALAAAWRPSRSLPAVSAGLASIPAAFLPSALSDAMGLTGGSSASIAVSSFLAAMEAAFVLLLVLRGFLATAPFARAGHWMPWVAVGFIGMSVVHFVVE